VHGAAGTGRHDSHRREHPLIVSATLRTLLSRICTRVDANVELYDNSWKRMYPEHDDEAESSLKASCRAAAASGSPHLSAHGVRAAVHPLRDDRGEAIGFLVMSAAEHDADASERRFNDLAELARVAVEVELASGATLDVEHRRSMRFCAALRFVSGLSDVASERELLQAVVQAAAIWFDVEASVYRREFTGDYTRFAAVPFVEQGRHPVTLRLGSVGHTEPTILSTADLEEIGWPPPLENVTLVPLGASGNVPWLLLLAAHPEAQHLFTVIRGVLASALEQQAIGRARELSSRLSESLLARSSQEEAATALVHEISRTFSVPQVQLLFRHGGRAETIAAAGEPTVLTPRGDWNTQVVAADRLEFPLPRSGEALARLILVGTPEAPFSPAILPVIDAVLRVLEVWLVTVERTGSGATLETVPFERRLEAAVQRAREGQRKFALLLVDVSAIAASGESVNIGSVMDVLRPALRDSDLVGPLGQGEIAALLGEVTPDTAASVATRVRLRLSETARKKRLPRVLVGQAAFPSGGESLAALVARARAQAVADAS